ncbi:hypothetical protein GCM10022248_44150 [Nonomuraea soli]
MYGEARVAAWCADLLVLAVGYDDPGEPPLVWIGGAPAVDGLGVGWKEHWPRVWGARGLLYAWTPAAAPAVVRGLEDTSWRVREMCAKVARLRELGEAADVLAGLVGDEVPRVRAAALRALGVTGEGEHAPVVRGALDDREASVRQAADKALGQLRVRLDRDL